MAEYRKKNREKILADKKAYYQKNKEWINGVYRQTPEYKAKHLAEVKAYADKNVERLKEYRRKNSARRSAKTIEWNHANRKRRAAYMKEYQRKFPEKFLEIQMARRVQIKKATPEERATITAWIKEWRSLPEVKCHWCLEMFPPKQCHSDHVIALGNDGPHHVSNLVIACRICNMTKNDQDLEVWIKKIETKRSSVN